MVMVVMCSCYICEATNGMDRLLEIRWEHYVQREKPYGMDKRI